MADDRIDVEADESKLIDDVSDEELESAADKQGGQLTLVGCTYNCDIG